MKLLLLSNSTNAGEEYLAWPRNLLSEFQKDTLVKDALFIPYAGVTVGWDEYTNKVFSVLSQIGIQIYPIHHFPDPVTEVRNSHCIIVGGGNTFRLVQQLQLHGLMDVIRQKVREGTPYIGWSAGSNIAGPTMSTTNDMPIVQPASFTTLGLISFQINPHYLDANPEGHGGETREQRIQEYLELNRQSVVAGLREGTALWINGTKIMLKGSRSMRLFRYKSDPLEIEPDSVVPGLELMV